jgi:hypothetical protein
MVTKAGVERPRRNDPLVRGDYALLRFAVEGAKSVLEFGPGDSTQVFLDAGVERVVSCEYIDKWYDVAVKRFKKDKRVSILKFTDTFPVTVEGLGDEMFDVAFVDAPKGWPMTNRFRHPGYEDCSRINTCLFALERAKAVFLHDAYRPLERGTLGRLHRMGFKHEFITPTPLGFARITHGNAHRIDTPSIAEPGSPTPRAKPRRRHPRGSRRPSGLDASGA